MLDWTDDLQRRLDSLAHDHLLRKLTTMEHTDARVHLDGVSLLNLSSNDYLALSHHPALIAAAQHSAQSSGVGAGASRLAGGTLPAHTDLERSFAAFKHAEAALLCPTGYMANLAAMTALISPHDRIFMDKLNHASLIDAARATGAGLRIFPHRNYEKLRRLLESPATTTVSPTPQSPPRTWIVTDSVFSMDGDTADLPLLCDLADQHHAALFVDEAHATGLLGPAGAGLSALPMVRGRVDVVVSTASKALGSLGGIITAKQILIDTIVNHARSFIFTTAVPPPQAAVISAALQVVANEPHRRAHVLQLAADLRAALHHDGWLPDLLPPGGIITPIIPLLVGPSAAALDLASHLRAHGFFAPAIRPPTVALNSARVRLSLRSDLTASDLDRLLIALRKAPITPRA